jgi:phospholipid transport system substrate-binding protein
MSTPALRRWASSAVALFSVVAVAAPCLADVPGSARDARVLIQDLGARAIHALGPSIPEAQRVAVLRHLLSQDFDLAGAARFALGPYARSLTPWQQQEFLPLYRDALAGAYAERLSQYAGEPFRVTGERRSGDETIVSSEVVRASGPPVRIDWQVAPRDGHLVITDVIVDGVSQELTQRQEFSSIIQRNGGQPGAVIAALRQQVQQELPQTP